MYAFEWPVQPGTRDGQLVCWTFRAASYKAELKIVHSPLANTNSLAAHKKAAFVIHRGSLADFGQAA